MTRTDPNRVNEGRRHVMAVRRAMQVPYDVPVSPTEKVWYWANHRRCSMYWPHQGKREIERARRQQTQIRLRRWIRALVAGGSDDAGMKPPKGYRFILNLELWTPGP